MNEQRQDSELLQRFTRHGEESAFTDLVRRHLDLVFATALRKVADPEAAQEIAQNVFSALARKAWRFAPDDSLPSWLHKAALFEAKSWLRRELGRRRRENTAVALGTTMNTPEEQPAFAELVPLLDEALLSFREKDRTALLLRFYESRSLREVGTAVGVSEDAARMRVQSALETLTEFFKRRGFKTASVAAVAAALEHSATTTSAAVATSLVRAARETVPPTLAGFKALLARLAILTNPQRAALGSALAIALLLLCLFFARTLEAATRPGVSVERTGTNVTIRFTGALQRGEQAQGPFRPVAGRSPWVVPTGTGQEFWRAWLPGVRSIAAGVDHSVALRADGTLWEWERNHMEYHDGAPDVFTTGDPTPRTRRSRWGTIRIGRRSRRDGATVWLCARMGRSGRGETTT
jgi:RNA polymerase sigma factor (sigma-70 family)